MLEPFDQLEPPPNLPKPKMPLGKVVLINFGIMLAWMILVHLTVTETPANMYAKFAADALLLSGQVGLNLLAGLILVFSERNKHIGGALLISAFITAVIGFGTCLVANGALT